MKTEIRKEIINHPDLGQLEKTFEYTYDETKYSSLEECIADHKKMESEQKTDSEALILINENITLNAKKLYEENSLIWSSKLDALRAKYESELKTLNNQKPIYTRPELQAMDDSKYAGKGYQTKSLHTKNAPVDVVGILSCCSAEEIQKIKELLK